MLLGGDERRMRQQGWRGAVARTMEICENEFVVFPGFQVHKATNVMEGEDQTRVNLIIWFK